MPRYIIVLAGDEGDSYLNWSTVVDAPVSWGLPLDEFRRDYLEEYGANKEDELDERLTRVEEKGVSAHDYKSAEDLVSFNRAGPHESALTYEQLYRAYCLRQPLEELDGWRA